MRCSFIAASRRFDVLCLCFAYRRSINRSPIQSSPTTLFCYTNHRFIVSLLSLSLLSAARAASASRLPPRLRALLKREAENKEADVEAAALPEYEIKQPPVRTLTDGK